MRFHYSLQTTAQRRKPEKCFQFERGWKREGARPALPTNSPHPAATLEPEGAFQPQRVEPKPLSNLTLFKAAAGIDVVKRPALVSGAAVQITLKNTQKHTESDSRGTGVRVLPRPGPRRPGLAPGTVEKGRVTPRAAGPRPGGRRAPDRVRSSRGSSCN